MVAVRKLEKEVKEMDDATIEYRGTLYKVYYDAVDEYRYQEGFKCQRCGGTQAIVYGLIFDCINEVVNLKTYTNIDVNCPVARALGSKIRIDLEAENAEQKPSCCACDEEKEVLQRR